MSRKTHQTKQDASRTVETPKGGVGVPSPLPTAAESMERRIEDDRAGRFEPFTRHPNSIAIPLSYSTPGWANSMIDAIVLTGCTHLPAGEELLKAYPRLIEEKEEDRGAIFWKTVAMLQMQELYDVRPCIQELRVLREDNQTLLDRMHGMEHDAEIREGRIKTELREAGVAMQGMKALREQNEVLKHLLEKRDEIIDRHEKGEIVLENKVLLLIQTLTRVAARTEGYLHILAVTALGFAQGDLNEKWEEEVRFFSQLMDGE